MNNDYIQAIRSDQKLADFISKSIEKADPDLGMTGITPQKMQAISKAIVSGNLDSIQFLHPELKANLRNIIQLFPIKTPPSDEVKKKIVSSLNQSIQENNRNILDENDQNALGADEQSRVHDAQLYTQTCRLIIQNIDYIFQQVYSIDDFKSRRVHQLQNLKPKVDSLNRFAGVQPMSLEEWEQRADEILENTPQIEACYKKLHKQVNVSNFTLPNLLSKFIKYQTLGTLDVNRIGRFLRTRELKAALKQLEKKHFL